MLVNAEGEPFRYSKIATCPPGTESVGRKCIVFGNDFVNNSVAIARCQQNGGHLYEPENRLVYARVKEIAREKSLVNRLHHDNGPWIGINDLRKENEYETKFHFMPLNSNLLQRRPARKGPL